MKQPTVRTSLMRRLARFIVPICFPFLLASLAGATRPGSRDNPLGGPSGNKSGSPPALQTTSDVYEQWQGEYKGTCDYAFDGKLHKNVPFELRIREPLGDGELGFVGGYDTDLKKTVTRVRFEIHLPRDPKETDNFRISSGELSIEHTKRCPYKADFTKTAGPSGKTILSGSIVGYQIGPEGAFSSVIVMDVRSFRVMR